MSAGPGFGSTLTTGVQQISAFLPLLGTEQCENHVGSALTQGYLYAAASPISLFGSLGVARAGFKTLMCAISIPQLKVDGAKLLANAGFEPKGMNLSLIMLDEERKSYCAENRIDLMMKELHIEDSNRVTVVAKNLWWNVQMIGFTALSCAISITPYIHLNLQEPNSLNHFVRWAFPVIRAVGSFLVVMTMQLVIQMRLLAIVRKWLILKGLRDEELKSLDIDITDNESYWVRYPGLDQRCLLIEQQVRHAFNHPLNPTATCLARLLSLFGVPVKRIISQCLPESTNMTPPLGDAENASPLASPNDNQCNNELPNQNWKDLEKRIREANGSSLSIWMLLMLLLVGVALSVAGYIGCFSAVQGSGSPRATLLWLGLEVTLSIIRMIVWGLNPNYDDAPPLEFKFQLDDHPPLPTCTHTAEQIVKGKTLPLVRADEFLQSITSYAGLLKQFSHPLLTLYYTLVWKCQVAVGEKNERILYITIFDHAERTTRVYTESDLRLGPIESLDDGWITAGSPDLGVVTSDVNATKPSYFFSAGPITIDLQHDILKASLGSRIGHDNDPIAMNSTLQTELANHYHSILGQVNNRKITNGPVYDTFKDHWCLRFRGAIKMQGGSESGHKGMKDEQVYGSRDHVFLEKGRLERMLKRQFCSRRKWIERYMKWSSDDIHSKSSTVKMLYPIEGHELDRVNDVIQRLLKGEQEIMEHLLVYEVHRYEEMLWEKFQGMIDDDCSRETVVKRWRAGLGERLEVERQAMLARISTSKNYLQERISHSWLSIFKQLTSAVSIPAQWDKNLQLRQFYFERELHGSWGAWIGAREKETQRRLDSELEELEDRLRQGIEYCDQFETPDIEHRHSDSKWQRLFPNNVSVAALKRNPHVCHITLFIDDMPDHDLIALCETLPQCTSIFIYSFFTISMHIPLPPNILFISSDVTIPQSTRDLCAQNQLKETTRTTFEFANMNSLSHSSLRAESSATFTIRFFGPLSSMLTLQLSHAVQESGQMLHIEMNGSPSERSVPHIKMFEEIQIYNASAPDLPKSALVFIPKCHNILTVFPPKHYQLFVLELLDERWRPYRPDESGGAQGRRTHGKI